MAKSTDKKDACQRRDRKMKYRKSRDKYLTDIVKEIVGNAQNEHRHRLYFKGAPLDRVLYDSYSSLLRERLLSNEYITPEWEMLLEDTKAHIISLAFEQKRCIRFTVKIHPELHDRWISSKRSIKAEIREALTKQLKTLGVEHMAYFFAVEGHHKDGRRSEVHIHGMAISPDCRDDARFKKALGLATGNGTRGRPSVSHAIHMDPYEPARGWIGYITKNLHRKDDRLGSKRFAFCRKATDMGRTLYNALLGRNSASMTASTPTTTTIARHRPTAAPHQPNTLRARRDGGIYKITRQALPTKWAA